MNSLLKNPFKIDGKPIAQFKAEARGWGIGYESAIREIKRELDNAWSDNDRFYIIQRILKGGENGN